MGTVPFGSFVKNEPNGTVPNGPIRGVEAFKEKPDLETAKKYLADGNYLWNAGIFVWNVKTITDSIRAYKPELAKQMDKMVPLGTVPFGSFVKNEPNGTVPFGTIFKDQNSLEYPAGMRTFLWDIPFLHSSVLSRLLLSGNLREVPGYTCLSD